MIDHPDIQNTFCDEHGNTPRSQFSVKAVLVIILGSIVFFLQLASVLRYYILGSVVSIWTILLLLGDFAVVAAMILCTLKKKIPAVFFSSLALVAFVAELIINICETIQISRTPNAFSDALGMNFMEIYVTNAASVLLIVLLLLYAILRYKHGDNIVWMIVFLVLYTSVHILIPLLFGGVPYYFLSGSILDILQAFSILVLCAFYTIGYSPDKWYHQKDRN